MFRISPEDLRLLRWGWVLGALFLIALVWVIIVMFSEVAHAAYTASPTCHVGVQGTNPGTNYTSAAVDCTGVDLLIAEFGLSNSIASITITDSSGNSSGNWLLATNKTSGGSHATRIYYLQAPLVSSSQTFTINVTSGATIYMAAWLQGFTGSAVNPLETTTYSDSANNSTTATVTYPTGYPAGTLVTPPNAYDLVVTSLSLNASSGTITLSNSWPVTGAIVSGAGAYYGAGLGYSIQGSPATAVNPSWTMTASGALASTLAFFKAAAGAPPAPPLRLLMGVGN